MTMTLIKGRFKILGAAPDGDSVRFYPTDPESFRRLLPGVRTNHAGGAQVRLDGIDALETHYRPREGSGPVQHQRKDFSDAASEELLRFLGFSEVSRARDQIVTVSYPEYTEGYVLTRRADVYGRSIAFVFTGTPAYADASQVRIEETLLAASANYHLLAQGLVYPSYFSRLYPDLRAAMTVAVLKARADNKGLWPHDETITGFMLDDLRSLTHHVVMLPKLFRRVADYLALGDGNLSLARFKPYLEARNERIVILPQGHVTALDFVVQLEGQRLRLDAAPENLVFLER
jgi:endonuclease YncB( thermonuclease family)